MTKTFQRIKAGANAGEASASLLHGGAMKCIWADSHIASNHTGGMNFHAVMFGFEGQSLAYEEGLP